MAMLRISLRISLVFTVACILLTGTISPAHGMDLLGGFIGGPTYDVLVRDNYAYLAVESGMAIVDVSDRSNPVLAAFIHAAPAYAIDLTGRYAMLARGSYPLMVIDIGDPRAPRIVGEADTRGSGEDIRISGRCAYLVDYRDMRVFNIEDPVSPTEIADYKLVDTGRSIDVSGSYVYVAADDAGLRVIDISDPWAPRDVGGVDVPNRSFSVCVSGAYAFITDQLQGLIVVDISDPENPAMISYETVPGIAVGVSVSGKYAYVSAMELGFSIVDISDPGNPEEVGGLYTEGRAIRIQTAGDHAFVAAAEGGLRVVDVTDPARPSEVGYYRAPHTASGVDVSGSLAYVAEQARDYGLDIIDVSDPASPLRVGAVSTGGVSFSVRVIGDLAYLTDCGKGFRIYDVSDPAGPVALGYVTTAGCAVDAIIEGDLAYVLEYHSGYTDLDGPGLRIVDVQNPHEPEEIWSGIESRGVRRGDISGGYLYLADRGYGLRIIDVKDPSAPVQVSEVLISRGATAVAVSGDYAYVGGDDDLKVIDVSNPLEPAVVGGLPAERRVRDVFILDDYAYIGDRPGLRVIDISDPAVPVEVDRFELPGGFAHDIFVVGSTVYAADVHSGLWVIKFLQPFYLTGQVLDLAGNGIEDVTVILSGTASARDTTDSEGSYEFVGLDSGDYTIEASKNGWTFEPDGLVFTNLSGNHREQDFAGSPTVQAGSFRIVGGSRGYVRPAAGEVATIIINPADPGDITVSVLTVRGQEIWSTSGHVAADKETRIEWDCRNDGGDLVASGIYVVQLTGAGFSATEKIAVVK